MEDLNTIAKQISELNPADAQTLLDIFKDDYGIEPVGGGVVFGDVSTDTVDAVEEKSEFEVILTAAGNSKLPVIKLVRELTSLGLREAKALVDGVPSTLRESVSKDEANMLKSQLENIGATVELK